MTFFDSEQVSGCPSMGKSILRLAVPEGVGKVFFEPLKTQYEKTTFFRF